MDKNLDRKIYMEDQLKNIDVNFHRIKGLNGSNIKNGKIDGVNFKNNFNLSNSEIGCTLSHLKAIKTAYDYKCDVAIICEDDVNFITCTLNPDIKYIISNAPKDWEIIQLITTPYKQKKNTDKYVKRHPQTYYCCACYAINRIGMKKVIDYSHIGNQQTVVLNKTKLTPIGVADDYIFDIVNTYSYFPNLFSVNNTKLESTIHQNHSASHIKNSTDYLNTFREQIKFSNT
jgi:glycosyl transferase family 25